jgi:hypothetical protein
MKYIACLLLLLITSAPRAQHVTASLDSVIWKGTLPFDTAAGSFAVTNTTNATLSVTLSGVKAPFAIVGDSTFSIGPSATDTVNVIFVPTDVRGTTTTDSVVLVNSGGQPYGHIFLAGTSKHFNEGTVNLTPDSLDFGSAVVGQMDTLSVNAKNGGKSNLTVSANMENSANGHAAFTLLTHANLKIVTSEKTLTLFVQFAPLTAGAFEDTLLIFTNDTLHPEIRVPIRGEGIPNAGVREVSPATFSISPLIANRELVVQTGSIAGSDVEIVDLLGREYLRTHSQSEAIVLHLASLPNGPYLCIVKSAERTFTARFIVQR